MTTPTQANDAGGAAALYARKYHEARAEIERLTAELDRRNGNPSTRLHNLCEAIAQERDGSEFSREEWERIDADNARLRAANAALTEALKKALAEHDDNTCTHESTHRGGAIWTICDDCGAKWADDEGGFVPYTDPPRIVAARAALASVEVQ